MQHVKDSSATVYVDLTTERRYDGNDDNGEVANESIHGTTYQW